MIPLEEDREVAPAGLMTGRRWPWHRIGAAAAYAEEERHAKRADLAKIRNWSRKGQPAALQSTPEETALNLVN